MTLKVSKDPKDFKVSKDPLNNYSCEILTT